jgi:pilus assembly protein CpaB
VSRGRRAALLAGLALTLGTLAASDMARREAALDDRLGPAVPVLVAAAEIAPGRPLRASSLAVRGTPERYAPADSFRDPAEVDGARAGVRIPAGADIHPAHLAPAAAGGPRPGERVARIVAVGAATELAPGTLADVLVTRDGPAGAARTRVMLERAEVLASSPAPRAQEGDQAGLPRVAVALRVTLAQAVDLVEAQNDARELRVLPRP